MADSLTISEMDLLAEQDRFHRFQLIGWWNQDKLKNARVLVVGAGALGNELIKNLALLGIGNIFIADLDTIENSNLSRSVLYRESDNGQPKSTTAASAAKEIYPEINVQAFHGDIVNDLGIGVFRWADIVLAGLDNREARLAINRNCLKVNRPWIDGAIEQIQGVVKFFATDGPCYECTMSEIDWRILQQRRSCNLLSKEEMRTGRTPTTPTISSIIAGVQCQEAVKYLHELPTMKGRGWMFEGLSGDSYSIEYQRKEDCYSHETLDEIRCLKASVHSLTCRELLAQARRLLGNDVQLELGREIIETFDCPKCATKENVFKPISRVKSATAYCPVCNALRTVTTFFRIDGTEPFIDLPLAEIGIPPLDIVFATTSSGYQVGIELSGDARAVLGDLLPSDEGLAWE